MSTAFWNSSGNPISNDSLSDVESFLPEERDNFTGVLEKFASKISEQLPEKYNLPCFISYPCIEENEDDDGSSGGGSQTQSVTDWARQLIDDLKSAGLDVQCDLDYLESGLDRATYLQELILRKSASAAIIGTDKFQARIEKSLDPALPKNNNSLERLERESFRRVTQIQKNGGNVVIIQLRGQCGNSLATLANVSTRNVINFDGSFPIRTQLPLLLRSLYQIDQRSVIYQDFKTAMNNLSSLADRKHDLPLFAIGNNNPSTPRFSR